MRFPDLGHPRLHSSWSALVAIVLVAGLGTTVYARSKAADAIVAGTNSQRAASAIGNNGAGDAATTEATTPGSEVPASGDAPAGDLTPGAVEIATAKACELEVVAEKGAGPSGSPLCNGAPAPTPPKNVEPKANGSGKKTGLPEIPRMGYASAAARRTPLGWAFTNPTYWKGALTFLVTGRDGDWVKVLISARPNHIEGWVRAADVTITSTDYRMELKLSDFRLVVYKGAEVVADTRIVTGNPGTPTPVGRFFVNDKVRQSNPYGSYGPWILSTNGYSEALDTFDNGLPVIALHGTNAPGLIGTQNSNGCVRMTNDVVTTLATTLPLGTPIDIVA